MVHPPRNSHPLPLHLPTPTRIQQANTKPPPLPRHRFRIVHGYLLAVYPTAPGCPVDV